MAPTTLQQTHPHISGAWKQAAVTVGVVLAILAMVTTLALIGPTLGSGRATKYDYESHYYVADLEEWPAVVAAEPIAEPPSAERLAAIAAKAAARARAEKARGFVSETQVLLGPDNTRPLRAAVDVPSTAVRVEWTMTAPPVGWDTKVVVAVGNRRATQAVPEDNLPVRGGMSVEDSLVLTAIPGAEKPGTAVICSLRFYSKRG